MRHRLMFAAALVLAVLPLGAQFDGWLAERNGPLPAPLPLFPATNWWNQDITSAPVAPQSASFIDFIGATRGMHPDFGGFNADEVDGIYGMPYVVVGADQPKRAVQFYYAAQSDGVDHTTGQSYPFYPIPDEAITQAYWIEGGPAGNADVEGDRHMLIVDRDHRHLYELYDLGWNAANARWEAGSGAFFDLNVNGRRPEGWTSADAAGLAILPGLVRYDEAVTSTEPIRHALRVTVRGVNGYVWPASHLANTNAAGPPLGARMRLKASKDIRGFPPEVRRIFQAMKTHGLIVADTGSSMYVSGMFHPDWNNDVLNPAFNAIKASDFEFVELGWRGGGAPCDLPGAPTGFSATGSGLQASFAWNPPASGAPTAGYVLEAGSSSGAANIAALPLAPTATTYGVTAPAGTYFTRVRASNSCGLGPASNEQVVTLVSTCSAPGVPGTPTATVVGLQATLAWAPAPNATSYVLEAGSALGTANLLTAPIAATGVTTSAPPGTYYVRVRGQNSCGIGAPSADRVVTIGGCAMPGAPGTLNVSVSGRQVQVVWGAAAGATDYVLEVGSAAGLSNLLATTVAGTTLNATAPPGTFYVRIRSRSACGVGGVTADRVVTIL